MPRKPKDTFVQLGDAAQSAGRKWLDFDRLRVRNPNAPVLDPSSSPPRKSRAPRPATRE